MKTNKLKLIENVTPAPVGSTALLGSVFLTAAQIPIGSWWEIAQGGEYGYCVIAIDVPRQEATVLSTDGETRTIDTFKLQYRYSRVLPNAQGEPSVNTFLP
jgi:hypothetical protein